MVAKLLIYKILQLFCMMLIGIVIAKLKIVTSKESSVLSKISLYLLMPSAIINAPWGPGLWQALLPSFPSLPSLPSFPSLPLTPFANPGCWHPK